MLEKLAGSSIHFSMLNRHLHLSQGLRPNIVHMARVWGKMV